jgi:hypothetical protein
MLAQEKGKTIEHLVWASAGSYSSAAYDLGPLNPNDETYFQSPILMTFHVPKSKGSPALFFEVWSQFWYRLGNTSYWDGQGGINLRILSNDIPYNVEVRNGAGILEIHMTNYIQDWAFSNHRINRGLKMIMQRDAVDFWIITYNDTGENVPYDTAVSILSKLIDKGFDVEVWAEGYVQGFTGLFLNPVFIEVTRLSKKI